VKAVRRILVPVRGGPIDQDALDLAFTLARRQHARVEAIHVIKVKRDLPIDADMSAEIETAERLLDEVERLVDGEMAIETSLLQARDVGAAIVDEAVQTRADAIVMGLPYKRKFGEYTLGSVAQYVLKNAPCLVCVVRQAGEAP
jgi:nucleotide-binding universal stress UspA family protein